MKSKRYTRKGNFLFTHVLVSRDASGNVVYPRHYVTEQTKTLKTEAGEIALIRVGVRGRSRAAADDHGLLK